MSRNPVPLQRRAAFAGPVSANKVKQRRPRSGAVRRKVWLRWPYGPQTTSR